MSKAKIKKENKNKFLIITNHSYMLWQFRKELILELKKYGDIVISTPFTGHEYDFEAIGCNMIKTNIDRRGINPLKDLRLIMTYKNIIKSEKPDIVITYSIKPNIYAGYVCSYYMIPYYVNIQGLGTAFQKEPIASLVTAMYKSALQKANTAFFENAQNKQIFIDKEIIKEDKICLLNGAGVNLDFYKKQPYPSEDKGIHILYIGRIMKEKGVEELFEAIIKLKLKYKEKVIFDIVGFFEDEYKKTVEELAENNMLVFHGFQTDTRPYYKSSHCLVLPSYHEGMSNVILEAASTGRAVICSDIPGCREAVEENISGYLCRKMDSDSLYECMERFILLDKKDRENMGLAGRYKMEKEFDKNLVVKTTMSKIMENGQLNESL